MAIALAQLLTARGTIECDVTVTRLAPERFLVLTPRSPRCTTSTGSSARAGGRERDDRDVTPRWGVLILAGPRAREVLGRITDADLSNAAFPWLSAREIQAGPAPVRALRINFVGELGWSCIIPSSTSSGSTRR